MHTYKVDLRSLSDIRFKLSVDYSFIVQKGVWGLFFEFEGTL